jgi:HEPN domain-containing protein
VKQLLAYEVYLKKALSDLKAATKLMEDNETDPAIICFHLQQFVEKYMKAYLIFNNFEPKIIHDLSLLLVQCINIDSEFSVYEDSMILELTDCGVIARYDDVDEIDIEFVNNVLPAIEDIKTFIESKLFLKLY